MIGSIYKDCNKQNNALRNLWFDLGRLLLNLFKEKYCYENIRILETVMSTA